jgi:homoserine kinase type II
MSVYTKVDSTQLAKFLERYVLGRCNDFRPIAAGVTNTNYFIDTEGGSYVLTLYEHHSDDELEYILGLQKHLAERSIRCASPVLDRRGDSFSILNNRPAAIIHRVPGTVVSQPSVEHCNAITVELARFHLAGKDFDGLRPNPRGLDWMVVARDMLGTELSADDDRLIDACLQDYQNADLSTLPWGAIHADLFHDNALFDGDELGGIIDFDYACVDWYVFDLAVMINDWCADADGGLQPALFDALLRAYAHIRPLSRTELELLPLFLRVTALRFWLSRLYDKTYPLSGELTTVKSPDEYRRQLVVRGDTAAELSRQCLAHAPD